MKAAEQEMGKCSQQIQQGESPIIWLYCIRLFTICDRQQASSETVKKVLKCHHKEH